MIVENERSIEAPLSIVWSVTENVSDWPSWTPTMESVVRFDDGPLDVGSTTRIKQPGLPEAVWKVTSLTRGVQFKWETRVRGIKMIASHELSPCGEDTKCVLRVEVRGILGVLFWPLISGPIRKAIDTENSCLKAQCEAVARSM